MDPLERLGDHCFHAEEPRRDYAWRRLRVILTGLVLCRGIVLLCVLPPFEGWDEYQHVGYIVYWNETGSRPWLGQADVRDHTRVIEMREAPEDLKKIARDNLEKLKQRKRS